MVIRDHMSLRFPDIVMVTLLTSFHIINYTCAQKYVLVKTETPYCFLIYSFSSQDPVFHITVHLLIIDCYVTADN